MTIPTFDKVMSITDVVSIHTVFSRPECKAYYDLISGLSSESTMCEIGVQYGRSSSIALQLQPHIGFTYIAVDPFVDGPAVLESWRKMALSLDPKPTVAMQNCLSVEAILPPVDLLLIDGDHTRPGVIADCNIASKIVKPGGLALFHDYGWSSTPDVKEVVDDMMQSWQDCGTRDTLHIRRRQR